MLRFVGSLLGCLLRAFLFEVVGFRSVVLRLLYGLGRGPVVFPRQLLLGGASHADLCIGDLHSHLREWVIMSWRFIEFCVSSVCCFFFPLRRFVVTVWMGFTSVLPICHWWRRGTCIHSKIIGRVVFSRYFGFVHGCADDAFSILSRDAWSSAVVLVCVLFIVLPMSLIAFEACVLMFPDSLFMVFLRVVPCSSSA